jgi:hypothetical protein
MSKKIPKEIKEDIVDFYKLHPVTIDFMCEKYGYSAPTILKILSQYGVKAWSKNKLFSPYLNEDYFNTINSHKKAYFLGLLTTDGCVFWKNKKHASVTVELQARDKYILEELLASVYSNRKLVYTKKSNTYTATITSTKMIKDLEQYHIEPKSSLTQKFYTKLPDKYLPDYYRGLIDGDGSFAFYSRPKRSVHRKAIRMCSGSLSFMEDFIDTLSSQLGVDIVKIKHSEEDHLYECAWTRNDDLETIINFLYSTKGPYLTRKKETADKILREIREYRDKR